MSAAVALATASHTQCHGPGEAFTSAQANATTAAWHTRRTIWHSCKGVFSERLRETGRNYVWNARKTSTR
jgi:hypothetical protein